MNRRLIPRVDPGAGARLLTCRSGCPHGGQQSTGPGLAMRSGGIAIGFEGVRNRNPEQYQGVAQWACWTEKSLS